MTRHACLAALRLDGHWTGALIEGPSGAGKSDLLLRALDLGMRLVSDDRTLVWASGGVLYGRAPEPLIGLIEARGVGILRAPPIPFARVALVVACAADGDLLERFPDPETTVIAGIAVPMLRLSAREASAAAKMRRAIEYLGRGEQQAYQARSLGGQEPRRDRGYL